MSSRQTAPRPRSLLVTDERSEDGLFEAIERLPRGGGILFRHYRLERSARARLARQIARAARRRGLVLLIAGDEALACRLGAAAVHQPIGRRRSALPRTYAVHDAAQLRRAASSAAWAVFLSPLFATRSHPGRAQLGAMRAAALVRLAPMPVFALGGMSKRRFAALRRLGFAGWAGIDAWAGPAPASADQNLKAVPT